MLAIINGKKHYRENMNQLFEVVEKGEKVSKIKSVFDGKERNFKNEDLVFEKDGKIIIYEDKKSRHPEDDYLYVRLVYLTSKKEFATRIYNSETTGSGSSNYFLLDKFNSKSFSKAFSSAFSDYLQR